MRKVAKTAGKSLRQAFVDYARASISLLLEEGAEPEVQSPTPDYAWVRRGQEFVRSQGAETRTWHRALAASHAHLSGLPECRRFQTLLAADLKVAAQFSGEPVGSAFGGVMLTDVGAFPMTMLARYLSKSEALRFDKAIADDVYHEIVEEFLLADEVDLVVVVPVDGVDCPDTITLDATTELSPLEDDEIARSLNLGVIRPLFPGWPVAVVPSFAIRIRQRIAKDVGWGKFGNPKALEQLNATLGRRLGDAFSAIRIAYAGEVQSLGELKYTKAYFAESAASFEPAPPRPPLRVTGSFDAQTRSLMQSLYRSLASPKVGKNNSLQTALRRFSFASERIRDDDRIVDLMVAGEALFLDPSIKGEITYRLALHAASFVQHPQHSPLDVFRFMRDAYGIRSDIVHGRKGLDYKQLGGMLSDAKRFISDLEDVVRRSLCRAVEDQELPPSWEALILSD